VSNMRAALDSLAELLAYPGADFPARVEVCRAAVTDRLEAERRTAEFAERMAALTPEGREELYTHTFDLSPACTLEIGWHIWGEAYERGAFLVRMRELLREIGLPESTELPDHLTSVLPALARIEPSGAADLAGKAVLPALDKILAGMRGKDNPYELVLRSVQAVIVQDIARPAPELAERSL
jgi:nitrate reductase molybdenum cofactor assembly chaperone